MYCFKAKKIKTVTQQVANFLICEMQHESIKMLSKGNQETGYFLSALIIIRIKFC